MYKTAANIKICKSVRIAAEKTITQAPITVSDALLLLWLLWSKQLHGCVKDQKKDHSHKDRYSDHEPLYEEACLLYIMLILIDGDVEVNI